MFLYLYFFCLVLCWFQVGYFEGVFGLDWVVLLLLLCSILLIEEQIGEVVCYFIENGLFVVVDCVIDCDEIVEFIFEVIYYDVGLENI